jgi:diguanylate cyclase (GGDEF)-like protein/PAS domain S-box-containing protein
VVGRDTRVQYASALAARLFGHDPQTMAGLPLDALFPPETAGALSAHIQNVIRTGKPVFDEYPIHLAGRELWLDTAWVPFQVEGGEVKAVLGIARDISSRKQMEEDLRRRAGELEAVNKTVMEINEQVDLPAALATIVERAARLFDIPMGGLYLLTPDGQRLQLSVVYGMDKSFIGRSLRLGEGLSGRVATSGKPLAVEDYQNWEFHAEIFNHTSFRRVLGVPLKIGERVIGVINLSDSEPNGPFSEDQVRLVSLFADQAALAVEKARMLEAERQKSRLLARSHALIAALSQVAVRLEATLDPLQIMETVGSELKQLGVSILIARFEQGSQNLVVRYTSIPPSAIDRAYRLLGVKLIGFSVPEAIWPLDRLVEQRRPLFMRDPFFYFATGLPGLPDEQIEAIMDIAGASRTTGIIYLPLVIHENALGMLAVWGQDLHEDDVTAFTVFANQVAVALENARLYNEIQKQAILDDMTGLYNRRGFFTLAHQHMKLAQRMKKDLVLIFVDVDGMKQINDTFGHSVGDQTLIDAAELLKKTFRSADIIARMGGDEFAVLAVLPSRSNLENFQARLAENLEAFNARKQRDYVLSISSGMVEWLSGEKALTLDELLSKADARMYSQKREKKNNI